MQGWIKLHRELFESDIWNDVSTFRLFVYLISKASYKDGLKINGIELKRGQFIRSYRKLADDLSYKEGRGQKKYSLSTIKSCVNKLIESERVNVQETEVGTLFTIINYAKYQDLDDIEEETTNAINGEVRTNTELTPNEVRTNSEQKEELKNLRREEEEIECPFRFHEKHFGQPNTFTLQSIGMWIDDTSTELVLEAMKEGLKYNARSFKYCERILRDWTKKGIKDIESLKASQQQQQKKSNVTPFVKKNQNDNLTKLDEVFKKMGLRKGEAQ